MYREKLKKEIINLKKKLTILENAPLAIQVPEGFKQYATEILDLFKEYNPILFVDPCFGACDLKDQEALDFGCKTLIHFGHDYMNKPKINTIFVPVSYVFSKKEKEFVLNEIKKLKFKKINLVGTINFLKEILNLKKELKKMNIQVLDSKESLHVRKHMVLGCDASTIIDKTHPIVYIGDGYFHANNIAFIFENTDIFIINPISKKTTKLEKNNIFLKQRYGLISKALTAKNFAILVSSKHGQFRLKFANHIKKKLEKLGKKVYIFASDYIKEEYILGMKIDCYVNTACPRISYDDFLHFKKPIITPQEVELLEDLTKDFKIDQIKELESFYSRN